MTYGDVYDEFTKKVKCKEEIEDYRPCSRMYGVPDIPYAIVIWLKDRSKIIYISEKAEKDDIQLRG